MSALNEYRLLDFGGGRRLERFGEIVLDRPCPAAESFRPTNPAIWSQADARFEGRDQEKGQWVDRRELPERWTLTHGSMRFELKRTDFGHLGVFMEQMENWDWIRRVIETIGSPSKECATGLASAESAVIPRHWQSQWHSQEAEHASDSPLPQADEGPGRIKVLNLFAYTGGSTLAAAQAGAEVVHLDAAKNIVAWARRNAELSDMADAPIRWIAEDAQKFVKRELRRGNRYDAVILDPPSYGHGAHGEVWRLSKHLPRLLSLCNELTDGRPRFILLTCHTPGYDAEQLVAMLRENGLPGGGSLEAKPLGLRAIDGRTLPSGSVVRWSQSLIPNP